MGRRKKMYDQVEGTINTNPEKLGTDVKVVVDRLTVEKNDIVKVEVDPNAVTRREELSQIFKTFQFEVFPHNRVVIVPRNFDIFTVSMDRLGLVPVELDKLDEYKDAKGTLWFYPDDASDLQK